MTAKNEEHFYIRLFRILDNLLTIAPPEISLFVAIDGSCAFSKIFLQRQRRRRRTGSTDTLDPCNISVGTKLMLGLPKALEYYFCDRQAKFPFIQRIRITISTCRMEGEGEHKIVRAMLHNISDHFKLVKLGLLHDFPPSHVVLSGDSDAILLMLANKNMINTFIMDKQLGMIINCNNLVKSLMSLAIKKMSCVLEEQVRRDFCFLSILRGNDYLPPVKNIHHTQSFNIYCFLRKNIFVDDSLVRIKNNRDTFMECPSFINCQFTVFIPLLISFMKLASMPQNSVFTISSILSCLDRSFIPKKLNIANDLFHWGTLEKCTNFESNTTHDTLDMRMSHNELNIRAVSEYLTGMVWIMETYVNGVCPDYQWNFSRNLNEFVTPKAFVTNQKFLCNNFDFEKRPPLPPLEHAVAAIPYSSKNCLELITQKEFYRENHPILGSVITMECNSQLSSLQQQRRDISHHLESLQNLNLPVDDTKDKLSSLDDKISEIKNRYLDIDQLDIAKLKSSVSLPPGDKTICLLPRLSHTGVELKRSIYPAPDPPARRFNRLDIAMLPRKRVSLSTAEHLSFEDVCNSLKFPVGQHSWGQ
eukprot:GHVL01006323.1.p1 GENE.GHVL01006323.1~~GHVL01006323.1.p1  ORF type:complete len:587 (-),score=48.75 GHVL01006323.1:1167-2927(-)